MALRITRLTTENYKRIKVVIVEPDPDGNLIVISGANASGKTSLLDSIENGLDGTRNAPAIPVRIGAKKSKIAIQIGDTQEPNKFTVRRVTDAVTRRTSLIITSADGKQYSSPQAFLDELLGPLSFDPLAFARKDPRKQADQLREIVGIDFTELDKGLAVQQEERTAAGREVKRIKGSFDSLTFHSDAGEKMVVEVLMEELEKRQKHNDENVRVRDHTSHVNVEYTNAIVNRDSHNRIIAEASQELMRAQKKLSEAQASRKKSDDLCMEKKAAAVKATQQADLLVDSDLEELKQDIARAEQHNEKYRENGRYLQTRKELQDAEMKHGNIKTAIEIHGEVREEMLAKAKFPVEGLGFDEHGVTYYDIPFAQASAAQQLRVSMAIGLSMNPKLNLMLIRDGSLLDKKSRIIVATMAKEAGAQVWMECVEEGEECGVVIEDGMVQEKEST